MFLAYTLWPSESMIQPFSLTFMLCKKLTIVLPFILQLRFAALGLTEFFVVSVGIFSIIKSTPLYASVGQPLQYQAISVPCCANRGCPSVRIIFLSRAVWELPSHLQRSHQFHLFEAYRSYRRNHHVIFQGILASRLWIIASLLLRILNFSLIRISVFGRVL